MSNLGDGVAIAAGPLLVASLTRDPFLVSLALLSEYLPTLLFGLVAGTAADRFDRRLTVAAVNVVRAVILVLLTATIVTGTVQIAVVLLALFALGTAETFVDTAGSSLVPRLVEREDFGTANARMSGAYVLANQLIGPPIGAFLFVIGMALPFAARVGTVLRASCVPSFFLRTTASGVVTATAEMFLTPYCKSGCVNFL